MSTTHPSFTSAPPRYRLPATISLGAVTLQVSNLRRSVEYYQRIIGLRVVSQTANKASLAAQHDDVILVRLIEKAGIRPARPRGLLGLYHFAILLPERAALGQFLAHLGKLGERAGMSDHLVSEAIYLTDPDGLGIEVYADRPRESWKLEGTTIAMATDPLDVRGLLLAGGTAEWDGAPKGTRIGHVHLYVGNLIEAARFYHEGLGFDRVNLQFQGALFMSAGGYHHHLGTNIWAANAPKATVDDARLLEWVVGMPAQSDVELAAASLEGSGFRITRDNTSFAAHDPWGTSVRVALRS